ncbi:uncharacterized protein LOC5504566 isoform X2 [Nematostella vectensis]|uniref:uncharacterized protein LOC5504566 isoform X2 n=1 Tax=Nematostella vectensis TaxID=45351 RepID=UPI002076F486|nr:uncharacterized protein LOC5504566 isoform X2 [Nematostella vectensis]
MPNRPGFSRYATSKAFDLEKCREDVDILFMMDSSGSIGTEDYIKEKSFVKQLASSFTVSPQGTHAALMIYSDHAQIESNLGQHSSIESFNDAVDRLPYLEKRTRIDKALKLAYNEVFSAERGARPGKSKIAVVLTDGQQTPDPDATPLDVAVRPLHDAKIHVFAIGVGAYYKREELQQLVQRDSDIYEASDFDNLLTLVKTIARGTCKRVIPTPPPIIAPQCVYKADLGFLMDASRSIGEEDFQKERDFVKSLASSYALDETLTGVITYSDEAKIVIPLGHFTADGFRQAVDRVRYTHGRTRIDKALKLAASDLFTQNGGRGVPKLMVILTDGVQTPDPDAVPLDQAVIPLRKKGVKLFAVGVGPYVKPSELRLLVESEADLFYAKDFDDLLRKAAEISIRTCADIKQRTVDGGWGPWSSWSACSEQACGRAGTQFRRRVCDSPPPTSDGSPCAGLSEQARQCKTPPCDVVSKCSYKADLGFIMDASSSIGPEDFKKEREFVKELASSFTFRNGGTQGTLAGVITYSDYATLQIPFGRHRTLEGFKSAVDFIPYTFGRTRIDKALKLASEKLFTSGRRNFPKVLVILTDGVQTPDPDAKPLDEAVLPLKEAGIRLMGIGVGPYFRRDELLLMVEPENLFTARDFDDLLRKVEQIAVATCKQIKQQEVDGGWSLWSPWTSCSASCGGGVQRRTRACNNPSPANGGRSCQGPREARQVCNVQNCAVDGQYTPWSSWGPCTKTCGGGSQARTRSCSNPPPSFGGRQCTGPRIETQLCAPLACIIERCFSESDLGFIMDASGSIGPYDFQKERDFVKSMSSKFTVLPGKTHVAVMSYSDYATINMRFGEYPYMDQVRRAIDRIPYTLGRTRIDRALKLAAEDMFTEGRGARNGIPKIAIILTDGKQTPDPDAENLRTASDRLRSKGVRVLAVGVGHYVDPKELRLMVDAPGDVYTVNSFDELVRKANSIAILSCERTQATIPPPRFTSRPRLPQTQRPPTLPPLTFPPRTFAPLTQPPRPVTRRRDVPPTPAPTRRPPVFTLPPITGPIGERRFCVNRMDLGFAMASSADIGIENYKRQKVFVRNVAPYMDISNYGNRFGVLVYGDSSLIEMKMEYYRDARLFQTIVDSLPYYSQRNRIDKALQTASEMFGVSKRYQEKYTKVLVLITAGKQTPAGDAVPLYVAARPLRAAGVRVLVIGVGGNISYRELSAVTEKNTDLYFEATFDSLLRNTEFYKRKICEAGNLRSSTSNPEPLLG